MKLHFPGAIIACFFTIFLQSAHAVPVVWLSDSSGTLGTVDVVTGNVSVIGNMGVVMTDLAFSPNGSLFGITSGSLYSIDTQTASSTLVGSFVITGGANSLVFDSAGNLYSARQSLYSIDPLTGAATLIGSGGDAYASSGDLAFVSGQLFLSSAPGNTLFSIDATSGVAINIGNIGFPNVFGLATDSNQDLYGISGTNILSIDTVTGDGIGILDYSGQGLGVAYGSAFFTEAGAEDYGPVVPLPGAVWLFMSGVLCLFQTQKIRRPSSEIAT